MSAIYQYILYSSTLSQNMSLGQTPSSDDMGSLFGATLWPYLSILAHPSQLLYGFFKIIIQATLYSDFYVDQR